MKHAYTMARRAVCALLCAGLLASLAACELPKPPSASSSRPAAQAQEEEEILGHSALPVVSASYLEALLNGMVGEVNMESYSMHTDSPNVAGWMLDAAVRSCINQGFAHSETYLGYTVQALYEAEVEMEYERLFGHELDTHDTLDLVEYSAADSMYFISNYLAYTLPIRVVVEDAPRRDEWYNITGYLYRQDDDGNLYGYDGMPIDSSALAAAALGTTEEEAEHKNVLRAREELARLEARIRFDDDGPVLSMLSISVPEQDDEASFAVMLDNARAAYAASGYLDEDVSVVNSYLHALTRGVAPQDFKDVSTQGGEVWFVAGLVQHAGERARNRSPHHWALRSKDWFAVDGTEGQRPVAMAEDIDALALELYGVEEVDHSVVEEDPFNGTFDEVSGYHIYGSVTGRYRDLYVWSSAETNGTHRAVATHYVYDERGGLLGYNEDTLPLEETEQWDGVQGYTDWLRQTLRAQEEYFVTVEYTFTEDEDGLWMIQSARRVDIP